MKLILLPILFEVSYTIKGNACNYYVANVTIKLLWCTVHRMSTSISFVCTCFVHVVLVHVLCLKRKNGFTDG